MRKALVSAGFCLSSLAACAGSPRASSPPPSVATRAPRTLAPAASASANDASTLPSLEDLARRGPLVAPGMHEAARSELATAGSAPAVIFRAERHDTCGRIEFVASLPVRARALDEAGNVLTESAEPTAHGTLGARGPVCVPRGDAVRAAFEVADGDPHAVVRVRWIGWAGD